MPERFRSKPEKTGVEIEEEILNNSFIGHEGKFPDELGDEWQRQQEKLEREEQAEIIRKEFEEDRQIGERLLKDRNTYLDLAKQRPLTSEEQKELDFVTKWLQRDYPKLVS